MSVEDPRLMQIRALHQEVEDEIDFTGRIVSGCSTCGEGWPCDTIRVLDAPPEAATPPQGIDRDTFLALLDELSDGDGLFDQDELYQGLLALVRPVEGGSDASS